MKQVNLNENDEAFVTIFDKLYKQTTTGKIQEWQVQVLGNIVTSTYGQVDGKLQQTNDVVKKGKNIGKVNETTPEEQAILKAQQLFDKKVKEGYVTDLTQAEMVKNNLDGIEPMLAFDKDKKEKYYTFPAFAQPKLDGFRCIAIIADGKCQLFTRTQKPINTLPHIVTEIEQVFGTFGNMILDGELYNHELKDEFEKICSYIKRDEIHPEHETIQYHIYDQVAGGGHNLRFSQVRTPLELRVYPCMFLKVVETVQVNSHEELEKLFNAWLSDGYEGAIYRSPDMEYENKRSVGLLKIKVFEDDEFEIVGVEEGTGKDMGVASTFVCKNQMDKLIADNSPLVAKYTTNGFREEFKANIVRKRKAGVSKPQKETDYAETKEEYQARREYILNNPQEFIGQKVTVQFQLRTRYGAPRFGQAWRLRGEE